jgi:hypothetical protein
MARALLAALFATAALNAFAELPPEVYRELQQKSPELVQIVVTDAEIDRDFHKPRGCGFFEFEIERHVVVKARVTSVVRSASGLRPGMAIEIRYSSTRHCEGWAGPRPIPVLDEDQRVFAYLRKAGSGYVPAARGASFEAGLPK